jgi:hypothetical protein
MEESRRVRRWGPNSFRASGRAQNSIFALSEVANLPAIQPTMKKWLGPAVEEIMKS